MYIKIVYLDDSTLLHQLSLRKAKPIDKPDCDVDVVDADCLSSAILTARYLDMCSTCQKEQQPARILYYEQDNWLENIIFQI